LGVLPKVTSSLRRAKCGSWESSPSIIRSASNPYIQ
jgi:hypothetical protein